MSTGATRSQFPLKHSTIVQPFLFPSSLASPSEDSLFLKKMYLLCTLKISVCKSMLMKKYIRRALLALTIPFTLLVILIVLLYLPPVQNWAVRKAAIYASEKTGMQVSVEHVGLSFPIHLRLKGVLAVLPNDSLPQRPDTVARVSNIVADVQLLPLINGRVEVDELRLHHIHLNTSHLVHEARVSGRVDELLVRARGIDIKSKTLRVNLARLSGANIAVELSDTVPPDTTKSEVLWKIKVDQLQINRSTATLHTAGDSLRLQARMERLTAFQGVFDLHQNSYRLHHLDWQGGHLAYDRPLEPRTRGWDGNHLQLNDLLLGIDSFAFAQSRLNLRVRVCAFHEPHGLHITQLGADVTLDSTRLHLSRLEVRTPESRLTARFDMDLNTFDKTNPGRLNLILHGSFGKQDLIRLLGSQAQGFRRSLPNAPLAIDAVACGNLQRISISGLHLRWPTAVKLHAKGFIEHPTEAKRRRAELSLQAQTYNLGFAAMLLPHELQKRLRIPQNISAKAQLKMLGETYSARLALRHSRGLLQASAAFRTNPLVYSARIRAHRWEVQHFLPGMGLHPFTGEVEARGAGTDFLSPHTRLEARARIDRFRFGGYDLDHITARAHVRNGQLEALLKSSNPLLQGSISLTGQTDGRQLKAHVNGGFDRLDLFRLRLLDQDVRMAFHVNLDMESNGKDFYKLQGRMNDITLLDSSKTYRLGAINANLFTRRDTTHAAMTCGDFELRVNSRGGYAYIYNKGVRLWRELRHQLLTKHLDESRLRQRLPLASVYLKCGRENIFMRVLRKYGFQVGDALVDLKSSPVAGLNGNVALHSLLADSIQLDTIRLRVYSDNAKIAYAAQVRNNKKNPQYVFNALLDGALEESGTYLRTNIYDANNRLGISLGLRATMEDRGIRLSILGSQPILGYKRFAANDSNYVFLGNDRRLRADLRLRADDGTGIQLLTNNDNTEALQDLTLSLNHLNLERLFSVLPYTPEVSGTLNGDFHIIQTHDEVSVSSAVSISDLAYQRSAMGNISTEFVYMPKADGGHYIDGVLMKDQVEVGRLSGVYNSRKGGTIDATLAMDRLPMSLVNGFIPRHLLGFKGYAEGEVAIKGTLARPQVNGEVYLDSTYMFSEPYGVSLRFANDPVRIVNSHLLFENFEVYAYNDSPLNVSGSFNFSDPSRMMMDVRMRATNYEIINARENYRSEVYGKVFVNFFGAMRGEVSSLQLRGKLDVLDATDMTYVLRDSPLSTDNQLEELVSFVDFSDHEAETVDRPPLTGFNMDLGLSIDANAHILCALNADKSNYIDLMGGGDLRMRYNAVDNLLLTGRYTLNNGEMKYSLPVIPLKTFTIKDGSYIEFTGNPMNPRLNITATETTKASVSTNGRDGRIVDFECGVVVTKTLKSMGLQFTIDAPQDMTISNQLNTMGIDERGKLAVTMLTTGMYLADGNTSGFSMNNALSAFLQSQINNITGNALRTLDLSFGLDNVTDASGNMHTDYSFKFAKRLWNNRVRIILGGKVSSGADVPSTNNTFFNNVSLEYRLNQGSTRYLQAFYNRDSYDWLEGDIGKYGVGFIWRRKLYHFRDIFRLKNPEEIIIPPTDSIKK